MFYFFIHQHLANLCCPVAHICECCGSVCGIRGGVLLKCCGCRWDCVDGSRRDDDIHSLSDFRDRRDVPMRFPVHWFTDVFVFQHFFFLLFYLLSVFISHLFASQECVHEDVLFSSKRPQQKALIKSPKPSKSPGGCSLLSERPPSAGCWWRMQLLAKAHLYRLLWKKIRTKSF